MIKAPGLGAGTQFKGLFSVSDWLPTLLAAAGQPLTTAADIGRLDGVDQWKQLLGTNKTAARQEVWLFADPLPIEYPKGTYGDAPKSAIRIGEWKLIIGPPGCPSSRIPPYEYHLRHISMATEILD
jgi:arylsulfatase A-like enzyme